MLLCYIGLVMQFLNCSNIFMQNLHSVGWSKCRIFIFGCVNVGVLKRLVNVLRFSVIVQRHVARAFSSRISLRFSFIFPNSFYNVVGRLIRAVIIHVQVICSGFDGLGRLVVTFGIWNEITEGVDCIFEKILIVDVSLYLIEMVDKECLVLSFLS